MCVDMFTHSNILERNTDHGAVFIYLAAGLHRFNRNFVPYWDMLLGGDVFLGAALMIGYPVALFGRVRENCARIIVTEVYGFNCFRCKPSLFVRRSQSYTMNPSVSNSISCGSDSISISGLFRHSS